MPARAFQRRSRFDAHEVFLDPRGVPNRRLPTHTVRSCGVEQRREKGMRGGRRVVGPKRQNHLLAGHLMVVGWKIEQSVNLATKVEVV